MDKQWDREVYLRFFRECFVPFHKQMLNESVERDKRFEELAERLKEE